VILNPTNLLLSLAHALAQIATASTPGGVSVTLGGNLFVHDLPANASNGVSAVLRLYGGPVENDMRPVPMVSVQCMTYAPGDDPGAGLLFAQRLHDALHDPDNEGRPRQSWTVAAKTLDANRDVVDDDAMPSGWDVRLIVLNSGPPGIIGRGDADSGGRHEIAFNFDVRLTPPQ
jgi:hypothetical protein